MRKSRQRHHSLDVPLAALLINRNLTVEPPLRCNRQILQRIDRHERIVVGRTGKARKFHYYCYKGGKKDDIGRIKA